MNIAFLPSMSLRAQCEESYQKLVAFTDHFNVIGGLTETQADQSTCNFVRILKISRYD